MLLVHWLARIAEREIDLVFIPISLRYGTNRAGVFLEAMAARLAELVNEGLQPPDKSCGVLPRRYSPID